jgi:hypothetical protein
MSVVERREDIKDLLLEVYFNRNQARRQTLGVGGGQFSVVKRMRTGGPGSHAKSSESIRKAHLKRIAKTVSHYRVDHFVA